MNWQKELKKIIKGKIRFNQPLNKYTTWGVGGAAEVLVEPEDFSDLSRLIKFSRKEGLPIFVLGAGSNLLISDKGLKGIVLKLSNPNFKKTEFKDNFAKAGAGLGLNRFVSLTKAQCLSGCEFLSGIPGTVGGALDMNAGAKDVFLSDSRYLSLSDLVTEVRVLGIDGKEKVLKKKDIRFGYRSSNLSKFVIISAKFKLKPKNKKEISNLIQRFLSYKRNIQDLRSRSAGCVFKNPNNISKNGNLTAGKMIDACAMKGYKVGQAEVSRIHANFILNKGGAKAGEIFKLMRLIQKRVKQKFNVSLVPEVKIIGSFK